MAKNSKNRSLRDLSVKVFEETGIKIGKTCINEILHELGFKYGLKRYIPRLTEKHIEKRYKYALKNRENLFQNSIFLDEV
jgi:transposase